MNSATASPVETVLRDELAREDRALGGVAPVLGHVLAGSGNALLNDAIVARVRGMLNDLASQFASRLSSHSDDESGGAPPQLVSIDTLSDQLASDAPILASLHATAIEGILTERLDQRSSVDPVLSPLMQELIASQDAATGETAMQALTAQSRFMQGQRRMQQPVLELSSETLERALRIWARTTHVDHEPRVTQAMRRLKAEYDEAQTRTGLFTRLVFSMRSGAVAALELEHAGLALFVTALASQSGQTRERAVLACHDDQAARLAVSLRAVGLDAKAIERQFTALDPTVRLPRGLEEVSSDIARAMLHDSLARNLPVKGL